ncbi:hypothetical protein IV203_018910 [Nitzschia inconspicua]|uniref:Uncharacterized protein n=1 Tax=Nitzschia inconspicua TaxID=303405 RepID=A0A9K3M2J5_9STRA|nr:hypothetical protein IV203_018910 [Nitzschia inconspicua]
MGSGCVWFWSLLMALQLLVGCGINTTIKCNAFSFQQRHHHQQGLYKMSRQWRTTTTMTTAKTRHLVLPSTSILYVSSPNTNGPHDDDHRQRKRNDDDLTMIFDWTCLFQAERYFIQLGIAAAFTVWPHLQQQCDMEDLDWLYNKLTAISTVLPSPTTTTQTTTPTSTTTVVYHLSCEYALATRLFIEEQTLDQNLSTGKRGKYAIKYHPRKETTKTKTTNLNNGNYNPGTRPLTVGEVSVNWRDSLRDTLLIKYHIDRRSPLPILQSAITKILLQNDQQTQPQPFQNPIQTQVPLHLSLYPQVTFSLRNTSGRIVIRVHHPLDVPVVVASLTAENIDFFQQTTTHIINNSNHNNNQYQSQIVLLIGCNTTHPYDHKEEDDHTQQTIASNHDILLDILQCSQPTPPSNSDDKDDDDDDVGDDDNMAGTVPPIPPSSIVWVDSSWYALQPLLPLFGDSIPRFGTNQAKCIVPHCLLSLYVSEWTTTTTTTSTISSVSVRNQHLETAMIHPWTDVLSWETTEQMLLNANHKKSAHSHNKQPWDNNSNTNNRMVFQ